MFKILDILLLLGSVLSSFLLSKLILWFLNKDKEYSTIPPVGLTALAAFLIIIITVSIYIFIGEANNTHGFNNRVDSLTTHIGHLNIEQIVRGKIAYKIPDTMEIAKSHRATVSVSKALNDSILFQNIDNTGFIVENIRVSSRVRMTLIDPTGDQNFQVKPLGTVEQPVYDSTSTIWNWNVIPNRSGQNELVLRATVKILDDLGESYKDIPVFEKSIKVNASITVVAKQFIGDYWQFLSTTIIIPLIVWIYDRFSRREKYGTRERNQIGFKLNNPNKKI